MDKSGSGPEWVESDLEMSEACQLYGIDTLECTRDEAAKKGGRDAESIASQDSSKEEVPLQDRLDSQLYVVRETEAGKVLWRCAVKDSDVLAGHLRERQAQQFRVPCHSFRAMLAPLAEGERVPVRDPGWLRCCMRGVLFAALRDRSEDRSPPDGRFRFPEHAYCWLDDGDRASSDEDRWAFYYGVTASAESDPECWLAFALLDDMQGEDFFSFLRRAMAVLRRRMGASWELQFGEAICAEAATRSKTRLAEAFRRREFSLEDDAASNVWVPLETCVEVVRQLSSCYKSSEYVEELSAEATQATVEVENSPLLSSSQEDVAKEVVPAVCCFAFLQMLMKKYMLHRRKQVTLMRLMFETASQRVLTKFYPEKESDGIDIPNDRDGEGVSVPQLHQILQSVLPSVTLGETALIYRESYDVLYPPSQWGEPAPAGIDFRSFLIAADRHSLFSRALIGVS